MAARIKIIGIGSPFGDDRLGWVAAEQLQNSPVLRFAEKQITIIVLDRPGPALISHWRDTDAVIIIDAVRSGAEPGTVHSITADSIASATGITSTHGFGIAAALELANTLGELPDKLSLCGIEMDPMSNGDEPGKKVRAALPLLVQEIEQLTIGLIDTTPVTTETS
jgi:hydrogenase maturation protease